MSGAVFTLGNSVSGSLGLGDALSKFGRVAVTGLTIEQDPDTVNSYLTTRYAGLSAVTSGGVTTFLNPSLVVIPSAYNNGIVYSLHSRRVNTGDFTVTRNTEARRFNSAGLIASVGSGLPRLDYLTSGGTIGTPALLVEPAATNLAPNANLMNQQDTPTASGGVTFTTGSTDFLAPDGTSASINKYVGGAASGGTQSSRYSTTAITATASGVHTFSIFVRRGATNPLDFCAITPVGFIGVSPDPGRSFFNLASGTAITSGARIENYGNGWYRLISQPLTLAAGDLIGGMVFELASTSGSVSFVASGALNLTAYTWGAQFEAGSVATSYIPTTTGTGSRSADVIRQTNITSIIGQSEGTVYFDVEVTAEARERWIFTLDSAANSFIQCWVNQSRQINIQIQNAGSTVMTTLMSSALSVGYHKMTFAYNTATNGCEMFIDGVQNPVASRTVTGTGLPAFNNFTIGGYLATSANAINSRIRAAALYTTRLTNQQLQLLTT